MSQAWQTRVADYVQRLELITLAIEQNLNQCQVDTTQVETQNVNVAMNELTELLRQLEESVAERERLLADPEAPSHGHTLIDKLRHDGSNPDLQARCEQAAHHIADTNAHAVSLFVCQYHLADFSGEIVRLLSGESAPPTYGRAGQQNEMPKATTGGLLDEAG